MSPQCLGSTPVPGWAQLARSRGTFFSQCLDFRFCLIRCSCHLGQDGGTLSSAQIWHCLAVASPPPQRKTLLKGRHHQNTSSWKKQSKELQENKLITSETNSACSKRRTQGKGQTEKKKWFTLKWECEFCVLDLLGVRGTLRHWHFCGRAQTSGCSLLGRGCRESSRDRGRLPLEVQLWTVRNNVPLEGLGMPGMSWRGAALCRAPLPFHFLCLSLDLGVCVPQTQPEWRGLGCALRAWALSKCVLLLQILPFP